MAPGGGYGYGAPPPGGHYGAPSPPVNPYAVRGSVGLGFLAGFFGACIGLGLIFALAKGPETKKGAAIGFGVVIALSVISNIITYALR